MSIAGNLKTMELAELLQWLSQSQKTGTLVINNGKIEKRLFLSNGRIVSSASTDPKEYLGHFLVAQGLITEAQLAKAVAQQAQQKMLLGKILVSVGAVTEEQLQHLLRLKAEESIYDIFTWSNGEFSFLQGELPERTFIPLSLDLTAILMEGARRVDEWMRIRQIVPDLACVPVAVTELVEPGMHAGMQRILALVDDNRSVEEIQEETQSTAFFVCGVLYDQVVKKKLKIIKPRIVRVEVQVEVPAEAPAAAPAAQQPQQQQPQQQPVYAQQPQAPMMPPPGMPVYGPPAGGHYYAPYAPPGAPQYGQPMGPPQMPTAPYGAPAMPTPAQPVNIPPDADPSQLDAPTLLAAAAQNIGQKEFERAMRYLRAAKTMRPDDQALAASVKSAEQQIKNAIEQDGLTLTKVPKLAVSLDQLTSLNVSAQEGYILTRLDGHYDLKSILRISPMPEVDALILFHRLVQAGYVRM